MLSRYSVYRPLSPFRGAPPSALPAAMNRLFQDFETAFYRPLNAAPAGVRASQAPERSGPRVRLRHDGDSISVLAELPGLHEGDVELTVDGTRVTLRAAPRQPSIPEGFQALRRERSPAVIDWSFELPYAIDAAAASATIEQGRLSVTLPRAPEAKPRAIPVKRA